jgi:uncharacterized protein YdaU (DUF1376 family)
MNRAPAFQFYADDFIAGTSDMTTVEVGVYIRLLCFQWTRGFLPNDEPRLFLMARTNNEPHNEAAVRYVVKHKFAVGDDGCLRNDRLEQVRRNSQEWKRKSVEGGKASAAKRVGNSEWGKQMASQRTINEPINEPTTNSPSPSPFESPSQWPTIEQAVQTADRQGICVKECAEAWWHANDARGGTDSQGQPIIRWESSLRKWASTWRANEHRTKTNQRSNSTSHNRNEFIADPPGGLRADEVVRRRQERANNNQTTGNTVAAQTSPS